MLTSLQALLRLASLRWLGVFVCALATLLATTSTASALEPAQTKTRVWGFDFAADNTVGLFRAASSGKHQGNRLAGAEAASGSLLAAEGAGTGFSRDRILKGFQDHHIVSDKNPLTKNHELLDLADFDLQSRSNKIFLPEEPALHPTRSIHSGKHLTSVSRNLAEQMDEVVAIGRQQGWAQPQYDAALRGLIQEERSLLLSGQRALNKNARPWAR